ncbi:MAG: hypothetical protein KGI54_13715 [Pseudomonadota bacterium]|nr:hypothetical protein [Pseudomonadota bacterium]
MNGYKGLCGPWFAKDYMVMRTHGDGYEQIVAITAKNPHAKFTAQAISAVPDLIDACQLALMIADAWIRDKLDGDEMESALQSLNPVKSALKKALGDQS